MSTDGTCYCGHVYDEHEERGGACTVDECGCVAFERDPEASND